jgi:hypothetical protein
LPRGHDARACARGRRPLEDLQIETLRLELRLHAELLVLRRHARLVLAQRRRATTLPDVQTHQRPVHIFLERVEREQSGTDSDRRLDPPRLAVARKEAAEGLQRELVEPRALGRQPFLERRGRDADAIEQRSVIERHGRLERLGATAADQPLELGDVDRDGGRVQRDRVALRDERGTLARAEHAAQSHEDLAQALACLLVRRVRPQEMHQCVARVGPAGPECEVRQERLRLADRQRPRPLVDAKQEAAEEPKTHVRHEVCSSG